MLTGQDSDSGGGPGPARPSQGPRPKETLLLARAWGPPLESVWAPEEVEITPGRGRRAGQGVGG